MGCGCNKNKLAGRSNPARGGLVARQNPRLLNNTNPVQARRSGLTPTKNLNSGGIAADQKRIQQIRRNAILKNLGKKKN